MGSNWADWQILFSNSNFDHWYLCSPFTKINVYMKDLFQICWQTKGQGFLMTFKVFNLGSKWPYFNSAYVIGGCKLNTATVQPPNGMLYICQLLFPNGSYPNGVFRALWALLTADIEVCVALWCNTFWALRTLCKMLQNSVGEFIVEKKVFF